MASWSVRTPMERTALLEAGKDMDLKMVGLHAVDSLRLERGFKHWPSDISPEHSPLEAGLGFAVDFSKEDFLGKEALLKQKADGLKRKLVIFTIDDPDPLIYHDEPIFKDGELVSENTHGAYGYLVGGSVGMCYLKNEDGITNEWIQAGTYEIGVNGKRYSITIHLTAPHDPKGLRARM